MNHFQHTAPIRVEITLPNGLTQSVPVSHSTTIGYLKKLVPNYDGSQLLEVKFQGQNIASRADEDSDAILPDALTLGGVFYLKLPMTMFDFSLSYLVACKIPTGARLILSYHSDFPADEFYGEEEEEEDGDMDEACTSAHYPLVYLRLKNIFKD